jgi:hypothetical protein
VLVHRADVRLDWSGEAGPGGGMRWRSSSSGMIIAAEDQRRVIGR